MNSSGVSPLDMRVVVKADETETVTPGGIIILDTAKEKKDMQAVNGVLIARGLNAWQEAKARSPDMRVPYDGDRVMFTKYGGVLFKGVDGKEYRIMNDEDIIGMLEG
jgi:chaperonin GroES